MRKDKLDDLELDGPSALRILDEIAWDVIQVKCDGRREVWRFNVELMLPPQSTWKSGQRRKKKKPVADLGGGMGGMYPPTSLKVTILAEKLALILNNSAPFRDASPPPT